MNEIRKKTKDIRNTNISKIFPLVSIVTPSFNQGEFIEDTLLSVKNQNYPNIEHIIIDGGSTDNTLTILKKYERTYNMHWISEHDRGQSDAINKGFEKAKGEIIGWINSDDCYFDINAICCIVKLFEKYIGADVIYGDAVSINENNLISHIIKNRDFDYDSLKKGCFIRQPAAFFRKKIIDNFKLDINLNIALDYDFWIRICKKHKFQYVNRIFAADRSHNKRKIIARRNEMIEESINISAEYGQFSRSWIDILFSLSLYGPRLVYMFIEVRRLYYKYDFAFDMKLDNVLHTVYRQIKH